MDRSSVPIASLVLSDSVVGREDENDVVLGTSQPLGLSGTNVVLNVLREAELAVRLLVIHVRISRHGTPVAGEIVVDTVVVALLLVDERRGALLVVGGENFGNGLSELRNHLVAKSLEQTELLLGLNRGNGLGVVVTEGFVVVVVWTSGQSNCLLITTSCCKVIWLVVKTKLQDRKASLYEPS